MTASTRRRFTEAADYDLKARTRREGDRPATGSAPTDKQINYLIALGKQARDRIEQLPEDDDRRVGYTILLDTLGRQVRDGELDRRSTSKAIDAMKQVLEDCPATRRSVNERGADEPDAGMYRRGEDIVRVYLGQRSGKMLLKRLVYESASGLNGTPGYTYEYEGRAAYKLGNAVKLTLEEAKAFGRMTGTCCVCARRLDDPESVDAGIGPVCAGKFA